MKRRNGKTFGSCISANVRRALNLNNTPQVNHSCGSEEYWNEACEVYGEGLDLEIIENAKNQYQTRKYGQL